MSAGKTYIKIASQTLTSGQVEVLFQNIPQNYTDLLIVVSATENNSDGMDMRVGNNSIDSSSNYSVTWFRGNGSAASSYRVLNYSSMEVGNVNSTVSNFIINLNNYSNTTTFKTAISRSNNTTQFAATTVSCWRNTSAINQISFKNGSYVNHLPSSTFTIYGIECAKNPYAEGGDKVYSTGTHWVHEFYNSGLFVPRQNLTADYLVVAGGGGVVNGDVMGGGGAGGLRSTVTATGGGGSLESPLSLTAQAYTVTVGAGGSLSAGSNSVFSTITSLGGGVGQTFQTNGGAGGSGGGAGIAGGFGTRTGGAGTANQGYAGGDTVRFPDDQTVRQGSGGGGGAGGAGAINTSPSNYGTGGAGGAGVAISISGSSVTYAGGGGAWGGTVGGAGGAGGGGNGYGGVGLVAGANGTANTGGGAGGGRLVSYGGSGIVIVRYPI